MAAVRQAIQLAFMLVGQTSRPPFLKDFNREPLIDATDPKMSSWANLVKAVRECPDVKFSSKGYAITGNQSHNITIEKYISMIRKKQAEAKKG